MTILTTVEVAEKYGTSASSVSRAAKRAGVGLRLPDGRLVGLRQHEVRTLAKLLHFRPGNPTFGKPPRRAS